MPPTSTFIQHSFPHAHIHIYTHTHAGIDTARLLLEFTRKAPEGSYDWRNTKRLALTPEEIGLLLDSGPTEELIFKRSGLPGQGQQQQQMVRVCVCVCVCGCLLLCVYMHGRLLIDWVAHLLTPSLSHQPLTPKHSHSHTNKHTPTATTTTTHPSKRNQNHPHRHRRLGHPPLH